jgi:carboxypeptidase Q
VRRLSCRTLEPVESFNVVGEVVGRELPDEVVVIGGHLDAWDVGQGAHDDGAGCIQAMEVLRLVHELDIRPRRTLRCVLFMNEENGLAGGRAYYAEHFAEMDRHVMALESDRGGFTPRGFTAQVSDEALAILQSYVPLFANTGADKLTSGGGGADIGPMRQSGVPLVGFLPDSQRYFDLHHSPADTIDQVNPRELQLGAAAMASLAWLVAEAPEPLPRISSEDE